MDLKTSLCKTVYPRQLASVFFPNLSMVFFGAPAAVTPRGTTAKTKTNRTCLAVEF